MRLYLREMLKGQKKHLSFHTPGHKQSGDDITELSYSDNLASPTGVIFKAEEEIARILGAKRSFILTDGSSCGVHAMLYALALKGCKRVAFCVRSHPSVGYGCAFAGITPVLMQSEEKEGIYLPPTKEEMARALREADALFLTSPDYYGNFPDLAAAKELCREQKKPLVIDGAHGAHLHGESLHASNFADMWVDGVHKSLPSLTQGAVVSATGEYEEGLREGVLAFRTTSPSYPIMASVEYAVKYPKNKRLEGVAQAFKKEVSAYPNADWSKILLPFGRASEGAQAYLEAHGVYPEFNDGNYLMFYLSPSSKISHLKKLKKLLEKLPREEIVSRQGECTEHGSEEEYLPLLRSEGRVCARDCGVFPPCIPLILRGEKITKEHVQSLSCAKSTFGLNGERIAVFTEE